MLVLDIVTLDPGEFFDDLTDIGEDLIFCDGLGIPEVAYVEFLLYQEGSAIAQTLFDDCDASEPIEQEVRDKLEHYFRSDFSSVRIHKNCDFDIDNRTCITFGENIYCKPGGYAPTCDATSNSCQCRDGMEPDHFAILAHELVHVLQYRKEGYKDFTCMYALECGAWSTITGDSCAFEQEAFIYQAMVLEDMKRDADGIFTCPLGVCGEDTHEWNLGNVGTHSCSAEVALCGVTSGTPDAPDYCAANDNCPDVYNPDQTDTDGDGHGDACDTCALELKPFEDLDNDCVIDTADNCACPAETVAELTDCDSSNDDYAPAPGDGCALGISCINFANPDQADLDQDGMGDLCDPDDDNDGHDDFDDNCPRVANPDQHDFDGDNVGNVCDESDGKLDLRRARVRENRNTHRPNGQVIVRGDIVLESPDDGFDVSQGLAFRVTDGGNLNLSFDWDAASCDRLSNGSVKCVTPDGVFKVENTPLSAMPGRIRFLLNCKKQDIHGPILPKLDVRIINAPPTPTLGVDRLGEIDDCNAEPHGVSCLAR